LPTEVVMRLNRFVLLLAVVFIFIIGCQSSQNPTEPPSPSDTPDSIFAQSNNGARFLWGYFSLEADLDLGTIAVIPARSTELHINATRLLNNSAGIGITIDPSSTPASGYFVMNVSITHPFAGVTTFTGFDVRGILLGYGSYNASGLIMPGDGDISLVNADGWSRWWNPSEFTSPGLFGYEKGMFSIHDISGPPTSMVNPYKTFADALFATADISFLTTVGLNEPNGRALFTAGRTNTRQYQIQFPLAGGPKIMFDYAIDASWAMPSPNPPGAIPGDFPIWANAMEPFIVKANVTGNSILGTLFGGDGSGQLELNVNVWDWQGWHNGSYNGQFGDIRLVSPGIIFDTPSIEQTGGLHDTWLSITAPVLEATIGSHPVLIEFPAPGTSWKQTGADAPAGESAAYAVVTVEVGSMECEADENNLCEEAINVDLISTTSGAVCMPFDGTDYYSFTIGNDLAMDGTITLDNFNYGDNDLLLYDGCPGDLIDMAMNPYGMTEVIEVEMLESGIYYIAVVAGETSGTDVQPYKLVLNLEKSGQLCTFDTNNNYEESVTLNLTDSILESVCAGGDIRDWYKITVPAEKVAGGSVYVDNRSNGNIDIRVYEEYPGPITFWGTNSGNTDELVSIGGLGPGEHYMEIFAMSSLPAGDRNYSLDVNLVAADYTCASGDGNDSYIIADVVNYTSVETGTVCFPADPDWFIFEVPEDVEASGTITLSGNSVADNDVYLYGDPEDEPIEYSNEGGISDEVLTVEGLSPGLYYIKCSAHPNIGMGDQPYTLTMDLVEEAVGDFDFEIHAHIIRDSSGGNPATSAAKVQYDVDWANEFYGRWGGTVTLSEISYIDRSAWLAASWQEMYSCHTVYRDRSGPINVYYVNSFTNMGNAAAYAVIDCRPIYHSHNSTYIAMTDWATNRVLAHELGHAFALLMDMYLFDLGYSSCYQILNDYCPPGAILAYCDKDDADYGNMMWWTIQGWNDPEDYWLSDTNWQNPAKPINSQVENWTYFHTNYENNF